MADVFGAVSNAALGTMRLGNGPLGGGIQNSLSGSGSIKSDSTRERTRRASLSGAGTLTAASGRERSYSTRLSGVGSTTFDSEVHVLGHTGLSGTSSVEARGIIEKLFETSLSGTGSLSLAATRDRLSSTELSGVASLDTFGGFVDWRINGRSIQAFIDEERTWQELTLSFRPDVAEVEGLREVDRGAGKLEIVEYSDGDYRVIDRSSGDNKIVAEPPVTRRELRTHNDYHLEEYDEQVKDQTGETYEVDLTLVADSPKESVENGSVEPESDEWLFEFVDGDVATDRVEREVGRGGKSIEGSTELSLAVQTEEAIIIEGSLNRLAAIDLREIPDGTDLAEDETSDDRNTVTISTPDERDPDELFLKSGEYVVEHYTTTLINDEFQQVNLEIVPKE